MISKAFSIALVVSDAKKSAQWYKQKLGFNVSAEDHWVVVWPKGAGWKIHLCETDSYPVDPGNTGIALYCDNLDKTCADLKKKGVKFTRELTKTEWGKFAMITDPDGNEFWMNEGGP